jgi:hypothetical protein
VAYEVFQRTRIRVGEPTISITPKGTVVFNAAASRLMAAAGIKALLLLWDKSTNKFAVMAALKSDKNAFVFSLTPGRSSGSLKAKSFLNYIGWQAKTRKSFPANWHEKTKMLEITLPSELIAGNERPIGRKVWMNKG